MNFQQGREIFEIYDLARRTSRALRCFCDRWNITLENSSDTLSEEESALTRAMSAAGEIELLIGRLLDNADDQQARDDFPDDEIKRLQQLNRAMNTFTRFMHQTADSIRPAMKERSSDTEDPMYDFEIEAKIDYVLRDDDSEWSDDNDSYLSSRWVRLTDDRDADELSEDLRYSLTPKAFQSEPLSRLLYELTEYSYGPEAPKVSLRNCLRIGHVFLDIQVWWQYALDIDSGKWIKQWSPKEFVETRLPSTGRDDGSS